MVWGAWRVGGAVLSQVPRAANGLLSPVHTFDLAPPPIPLQDLGTGQRGRLLKWDLEHEAWPQLCLTPCGA